MSWVSDRMFLFLLILFGQKENISAKSCLASRPTLQFVEECPKTQRDWNEESAKKGCDMLAPATGCASFIYHCLLNQFGNATVEVCAPKWYLSGFCAMYNTDESRVIDNFNLDCNNNTKIKQKDRCPSRYISTDTYKYQVCYNKRKSQESIDKQQLNTCIQHADSSVSSTIFIILFAATLIIAISLAVLLILVRSGRIWKNRHLSWNRLEDNIERTETEPQDRSQAEGNTIDDQLEDSVGSEVKPLLHGDKLKESSNIVVTPRKEANTQRKHDMGNPVPKNDTTSKPTPAEGTTHDDAVSVRGKEVHEVAKAKIARNQIKKIETKSPADGAKESKTAVSVNFEKKKEEVDDNDTLSTIEEDDNKTNDNNTHEPDHTHATSRYKQDNEVENVHKDDARTPATLTQSSNDENADTMSNTELKAEQSDEQLETDTAGNTGRENKADVHHIFTNQPTDKPDKWSAPMPIQVEKNVPLNVDSTCDRETSGSEKNMSTEESQQQGKGIVSRNLGIFDPKKKDEHQKC